MKAVLYVASPMVAYNLAEGAVPAVVIGQSPPHRSTIRAMATVGELGEKHVS